MPHNSLHLPYRSGVGLCLFNKKGQVLCAERRDKAGAWQMPQGGVQRGEDLKAAALREMKEEIGTNNAVFLAKIPDILRYEFPDFMQYRNGIFRGKYRGQEQTWYALLFQGEDADIQLTSEFEPEYPEFVAWKWADLAETPNMIVDFKRKVYDRMAQEFHPIAKALAAGEVVPVMQD